jgi:hypothetical protein
MLMLLMLLLQYCSYTHRWISCLQNSVAFTTHLDNYLHGLISTYVIILVFEGNTVLHGWQATIFWRNLLPSSPWRYVPQNNGTCLHLIRGVNWKTGFCLSENVLCSGCLAKTKIQQIPLIRNTWDHQVPDYRIFWIIRQYLYWPRFLKM